MAKMNKATRIALVTGEMRDCMSPADRRRGQTTRELHGGSERGRIPRPRRRPRHCRRRQRPGGHRRLAPSRWRRAGGCLAQRPRCGSRAGAAAPGRAGRGGAHGQLGAAGLPAMGTAAPPRLQARPAAAAERGRAPANLGAGAAHGGQVSSARLPCRSPTKAIHGGRKVAGGTRRATPPPAPGGACGGSGIRGQHGQPGRGSLGPRRPACSAQPRCSLPSQPLAPSSLLLLLRRHRLLRSPRLPPPPRRRGAPPAGSALWLEL